MKFNEELTEECPPALWILLLILFRIWI